MRIIELEQRSDAWLRWREQGITATESAVILGLSPFKTPWRLWAEKVHRAVPANLDAIPQVRFGREHEDHVRRLFERAHGLFVSPACAEMEGEDALFRASFDGLTPEDEPVEIKCPGKGTLADVLARGTESDAVRLYGVQVQHQIMVSGASHGWLVFYEPADESLVEFDIPRDEALIARIREAGLEFWNKYVSKRREPPMDPERDVYVPGEKTLGLWAEAAGDYLALEREIQSLSARIADLKKAQARPRETLEKLMGDHLLAEFAGLRVKRSLRAGTVDYDALLAAQGVDPALKDSFRREPTAVLSLTPTGRDVPEGVVATDGELAAIAEREESPGLWF